MGSAIGSDASELALLPVLLAANKASGSTLVASNRLFTASSTFGTKLFVCFKALRLALIKEEDLLRRQFFFPKKVETGTLEKYSTLLF